MCGRLDLIHIYAQRKLHVIFITKLRKLNNDVIGKFGKITSDECASYLQCEFDIAVGAFSGDIKDIVFKRFYNITLNVF